RVHPDAIVHVDEVHPHARGEQATQRAFPRAHRADQDDVTAVAHRSMLAAVRRSFRRAGSGSWGIVVGTPRSPTRRAHAACRGACADAARGRQCGMTDAPLAEALDTFDLLFAEARSAGEPDPTAMSLATADANGRPSLRTVLLKAHDRR